jgi:hypothetical protein
LGDRALGVSETAVYEPLLSAEFRLVDAAPLVVIALVATLFWPELLEETSEVIEVEGMVINKVAVERIATRGLSLDICKESRLVSAHWALVY